MAWTRPTIRVAQEPERHAALQLVLRPLPNDARGPLLDALRELGDHPLGPLDALVVAVDGSKVVAAAWAQPSPGRAAALWPPEWAGKRPAGAEALERSLLDAAVTASDTATVPLIQTLLESSDDPRVVPLEAAGFRGIATLEYLGRSIPGAEAGPTDRGGLSFTPYTAREHPRLRRLVKQTYVDSLDCPGVENLRDLDDVLTGYKATGRHDPRHWLIAHTEGEDVGVLLMAEHPGAEQAELIYMGVTPDARGNGYGAAIVDEAIAVARRMGVEQLMVAVDRANTPARRVYEKAGFAGWAHRLVYVRPRGG